MFTHDAILKGRVHVFQPEKRRGYRFNIDSILLAHFVCTTAGSSDRRVVIDAGAGCGVIGFILLFHKIAGRVIFVEKNEELVECCQLGVEENGFAERARVVKADIRRMKEIDEKVDFVVSNPPFYTKGTGRLSRLKTVASAKHEVDMTVEDLFRFSRRVLPSSGRVFIIFPARRIFSIVDYAGVNGFCLLRLQFVHPRIDKNANNGLAEFKVCSGRMTEPVVLPPRIVHNEDGSYCEHIGSFLKGIL